MMTIFFAATGVVVWAVFAAWMITLGMTMLGMGEKCACLL